MSTATVISSALVFECIDGKDDHFKIELENGQEITLGTSDDNTGTELKELENKEGKITLKNDNGVLFLDSSESPVAVKVNGKPVSKAYIKPVDIVRIGDSIWRGYSAITLENNPIAVRTSITGKFGNFIGLEGLQDFKLSEIFSEVFKKHTIAETEEQLFTGTTKHTPAITDIETSWAKPWLYSRLLLLCVVLTVLLIMGFNMFENFKLIPGIIFIGTFVMPLATLIFFLEMNAPRNVSIFLVLLMLFIGGVASLLVTLILGDRLSFLFDAFGASGAAIVEEPAKMLIVILVLGKYLRFKWILNGLLFGAAVGAGFGAFESAGYAFEQMLIPVLKYGDRGLALGYNELVDNVILRGFLAPFMHVIWTANAAAALWLVKGDRKFEWSMLGSQKFLRVFLLSVVTHFIWNSNLTILPLPYIYDLKYLILGVTSWVVCFMLIQAGLKQLNAARHAEVERLVAS